MQVAILSNIAQVEPFPLVPAIPPSMAWCRPKRSRSAGDYDPDSNWAAERREGNPARDAGLRGSTERLVDKSRKAVDRDRTPQRTEPDAEDSGER